MEGGIWLIGIWCYEDCFCSWWWIKGWNCLWGNCCNGLGGRFLGLVFGFKLKFWDSRPGGIVFILGILKPEWFEDVIWSVEKSILLT